MSRYCVYAFLNGAPIWGKSKKQASVAMDITDAESYAYSVAAVMAEVLRGRLEDIGLMDILLDATLIATDNDATLRIASDAASAKRALHILRRLGHTRHLVDLGEIIAGQIPRDLNVADLGTHYSTSAILKAFKKWCRGAGS